MKLKQLYKEAKENSKEDLCRFMRDMKRAKLKLRYYEGRWYWKGPAVVVGSIQDVLSNTKVRCQWDNMGVDYVVYPRQSL